MKFKYYVWKKAIVHVNLEGVGWVNTGYLVLNEWGENGSMDGVLSPSLPGHFLVLVVTLHYLGSRDMV